MVSTIMGDQCLNPGYLCGALWAFYFIFFYFCIAFCFLLIDVGKLKQRQHIMFSSIFSVTNNTAAKKSDSLIRRMSCASL